MKMDSTTQSEFITWNTSDSVNFSLLNMSNYTDNTRKMGPPCQLRMTTMNIVLTVCFTIIFTLSVIGNCLVIVTIAQNRWMRTVTNIFLQSLAISDLLLSVICMPPTLTAMLFHCFLWGKAMCIIFSYLQPVSVAASAYTLVAIALERYNAICRPLHSRHWKTKSHAIKVIVAVWVISLLCSSPSLFVYDLVELRPGQMNCRDDWGSMAGVSGFYYLFLFLALFVVPLFLMIILYSAVTYTLWMGIKLDSAPANGETSSPGDEHTSIHASKHSIRHRFISSKPILILRRLGRSMRRSASTGIVLINRSSCRRPSTIPDGFPVSNTDDNLAGSAKVSSACLSAPTAPILRCTHTAKNLETKKRVIIMLFAIVAEFLICWTPSYLYRALFYLGYVKFNPYFAMFLLVLAYLSSCSNPITYCFLNLKFRQAFLLAFGCRFMVKDASSMHRQNTLYRYNPNFQNLTLRRTPTTRPGTTKRDTFNDQEQRVIDNVLVQCHEPVSTTSLPVVQLRTPSIRVSSAESTNYKNCIDDEYRVYDSEDDEFHDPPPYPCLTVTNGFVENGGTERTDEKDGNEKLEKLSSL